MTGNRVTGSFAELESGLFYKIENTQDMPSFFINVATSSDVWMFLSSNGALTAGRQNSEGALFPYETDDRLHLATSTGPKTLLRLEDGRVWEPFGTGYDAPFVVRRNLYKRQTGDAVLFEEINDSLGMTFSYLWETSEKYGIVQTASIKNNSCNAISMAMLDGVQNIMPFGITQGLVDSSSCLTDAYKACERLTGNLAVFSLTSMIMDVPEPVEVLRANVAWRIGEAEAYLLSSRQLVAFAKGETVKDETNSVGRKGAYLACHQLNLTPGAQESWMLIMDARLSQKQVSELAKELNETPQNEMREKVKADIAKGTAELVRIVAVSDGLQLTADARADMRHYMNVLYNSMRGGTFVDGYQCDAESFARFAAARNRALVQRKAEFFDKLRAEKNSSILHLHELAYEDGDRDLIRLSLEFLPLTFSRRHGDPSRPWNRFHIRVKDENGNRIYAYEGNWRDIFQNWEAMSLSFPEYIEPIIAKFLNASTADGFNPYRISERGVDWEIPEPNNPWSGYGYWGDHQIVYLNRLLEWLDAYTLDALDKLLTSDAFTYANVPYEIKPYAELLKDGKDTLIFAQEKHEAIMRRAAAYGSDAKLLEDNGGGIYHVSFLEKLLVPVLAKLSNLVVDGGIWMNTMRPEWNDANNAIVGYGLSMVTVYQLYRHLQFVKKLVRYETNVSVEVLDWLGDVHKAIVNRANLSPRAFLDDVGKAFETYRTKVYAGGLSGKRAVSTDELTRFIDDALQTLAETIDANKRSDGMYNAYNILKITPDGLEVLPLFLMLEGQTAVLGSGRLDPDEALELVKKMESSGLMSDEHATFFLYPQKRLKTFMERNVIPAEAAKRSALLTKLLSDGCDCFVLKDANGNVRFHDSIRQSSDLEIGLARILADDRYQALAHESDLIREIYELVFAHREFTGRSGIMYKYEGIGSIYWHQNSKFILSFQEVFCRAGKADTTTLVSLKDAYYRLRAGLGFNKEPSLWGAFPLEPYSHTPYGMPAQQPGMTGQVKEDILTRNAEMGLAVRGGQLHFEPALLRHSEFLTEPETFCYIASDGEKHELPLEAGSLAFTVCQTPIIYRLGKDECVTVHMGNGNIVHLPGTGLSLNEGLSRELFSRSGQVDKIEVAIREDRLV